MSGSATGQVLCRYRELLRLIGRLPGDQRSKALTEARTTLRARKSEANPEEQLKHLKELVSKIGYLRIITPRQPGDVKSGVFVVRDGRLVEGGGEAKGARVADGTISYQDAMRRNERDFQRFYGAPKPKGGNILF
ncbi:hypothetical protein HYH03_018049 [Edaphochlamys debaryana]|uniref:Complex 1 LYR protein domain-containing protein n=1 Tax=Edaphochlamys debaryana TaxID=47281 RepID=A0A835XIS3_9CHLO|nr:hypothetical protein HYH03_018049 [Edaphochlamys debaryana]|eukprot:KAG2483066.1 hypothetical protein HYH03_018049 [Edaphochlamys debaryana]